MLPGEIFFNFRHLHPYGLETKDGFWNIIGSDTTGENWITDSRDERWSATYINFVKGNWIYFTAARSSTTGSGKFFKGSTSPSTSAPLIIETSIHFY